MKKKRIRIVLAIMSFALLGAGWYVYKEYNRKVKDLAGVKADVRFEAQQLFDAFEKNEAQSNSLYLDKIIAVSGKVKTVEKNDKGHFTVILGEPNSMSSVRCSMDSSHQDEVKNLVEGTVVTMKGACTGFNMDELLGSDVILNRCVLED